MQEELLLLNKARALDEDALTEIHDRYYAAIYRYIAFRVDDVQTVEDLTSDVFTRFLSALRDKNAPQNTIRGWLFGVASNVVKEHYRYQRRHRTTPLDEKTAVHTTDLAGHVDDEATREQLFEAMEELTEEQQQVLALRFGYGMPIREVADMMRKSEGSIKMLQVRAIAALTRSMSGLEMGS